MEEKNKKHSEEKSAEKKETAGAVEKNSEDLKKQEAVVNGRNLPISTKHAIAICNFIKGKNIEHAIFILEEVVNMKKPVPMRGEIPHKKGIMSGRYPVKASDIFIKLLKSLKANALAKELEMENYKVFCKADVAPRPYRKFGRTRFKRSHVQIKLVPMTKENNKEKKK